MNLKYVIVLLADGRVLRFRQRRYESQPEMDGRVLREIEAAIVGERGKPTPKGTRWAEWHDGPRKPDDFGPLGYVRESTGAPYADRTVRLPGIYDKAAALAKIQEQQ